ncbi:MAG TPA: polyprenol monophosphomannose synthase [Candidatus Sulfotelmatobacter sp.]|jgi:dolichol-phosphate mannosyltransferase|nr:polyprenol monophosphomannose synthase [Candidatus Sulfotelmatobacter sp.]
MNPALIILPTVNERENLPRMVAALLALPAKVDVLVMDGNSSDGTGQIADELAAKHPEIHVIHEAKKGGLGRAYLAGFKWALERGYEFIFEMDCDFSHQPEEIPNFLKAAENADLVLGSRYSGGRSRVVNWPLRRLLLSKSAGMYVRLVTGMPISDPTGGFKCFRRRALQALYLDGIECNGYGFQIELTNKLWRDGFRVVEVPITFPDRTHGESKMTGGIANEAFWLVWRLWVQNGFRRWPRRKSPPEKSQR